MDPRRARHRAAGRPADGRRQPRGRPRGRRDRRGAVGARAHRRARPGGAGGHPRHDPHLLDRPHRAAGGPARDRRRLARPHPRHPADRPRPAAHPARAAARRRRARRARGRRRRARRPGAPTSAGSPAARSCPSSPPRCPRRRARRRRAYGVLLLGMEHKPGSLDPRAAERVGADHRLEDRPRGHDRPAGAAVADALPRLVPDAPALPEGVRDHRLHREALHPADPLQRGAGGRRRALPGAAHRPLLAGRDRDARGGRGRARHRPAVHGAARPGLVRPAGRRPRRRRP